MKRPEASSVMYLNVLDPRRDAKQFCCEAFLINHTAAQQSATSGDWFSVAVTEAVNATLIQLISPIKA